MIRVSLVALFLYVTLQGLAQSVFPRPQAHAHNDYEHKLPLFDALRFGFISVEADVHLKDGKLFISHDRPPRGARTLQDLYLIPLDSLLKKTGTIYPGFDGTFYLMIDCKTEAENTFKAIQNAVWEFPSLHCRLDNCPVKIFISGNRAVETMLKEGYHGVALDGRPEDLGKGFSTELMPVISDHYANWSGWNGKSDPGANDLLRIRELAQKVHAEGKKLRLWAIPDNEKGWSVLLKAGVDFINTDKLEDFDKFLSR